MSDNSPGAADNADATSEASKVSFQLQTQTEALELEQLAPLGEAARLEELTRRGYGPTETPAEHLRNALAISRAIAFALDRGAAIAPAELLEELRGIDRRVNNALELLGGLKAERPLTIDELEERRAAQRALEGLQLSAGNDDTPRGKVEISPRLEWRIVGGRVVAADGRGRELEPEELEQLRARARAAADRASSSSSPKTPGRLPGCLPLVLFAAIVSGAVVADWL